MKAVIMAGGKGTRLREIASDIPKPMVPVCGKPVLAYQLEALKESGITDVILVVGYLGDVIREHFGDGSALGIHITYYTEDRPLGTAGALYRLKDSLREDFVLLMGDLLLSVDFQRMAGFHARCGAKVTLFVHPNAHPADSDLILLDRVRDVDDYTEEAMAQKALAPELKSFQVKGVLGKKEERKDWVHNLVNAGIYMLSPSVLDGPEPPEGKLDLDRDLIRPLIPEGGVYAYHSTEYVKDMGTPERYRSVEEELAAGIPQMRNLKQPQRCIFLDRDGTLNEPAGFISRPEALELCPGAAEAVRLINASGYLAVLVSNQPVVARGECSLAELDRIHAKLETLLGAEGAYLDDILFCPHHPHKGYEGEVAALKFECPCRKPAPGMLLEAARMYHIELPSSWMVGDSPADAECGKRAGCSCRIIGEDAGDVLEAVRWILKKN